MKIPSIPSRITRVTVYRSGAFVRREGALRSEGGTWPGQVRLDGLPLALDDGSLRVAVEAEGQGVAPLAVDLAVTLDVVRARDETLRPPRNEELEASRRVVAGVHREIQLLDAQAGGLRELDIVERPVPDDGGPVGESPLAARRALVGFTATCLEELTARRVELVRRLQEAQEALASLEDQERRATSARQPRADELRKTLLVTLASGAATATSARVVIDYRVNGARWAPTYAITFGADYGSGHLGLRAAVCQRTGEDWSGVPLTLSTAEALSWTELPELTSQRIGRRQPARPKAGWRPAPEGADALYADFDARPAAPVPVPVAASVPMGGFGYAAMADMDDFRGAEPSPECEQEERDSFEGACDEVCEAPSMQIDCKEVSRSMAPPPPPCPAPARRPMPAPSMARGAAGGAMSGLVGTASPKMAREEMKKKSKGRPPGRADSAGAPCEPCEDGGPEFLEAPVNLLDYGNMRLAGPHESRRGRLTPMDPTQRYQQVMAALAIDLRVDVRAVLLAAAAEARQAETVAPPSGCRIPGSSDGFDHAFATEAPVDLPSDGRFHVLPVMTKDAETSLVHVVVPREAPEVFRSVSFKNPLDGPLPSGPADITVGRDYLLTTQLGAVPAGGRVELCLGVEQRIKAARNVHYDEATAGLLGGDRVLTHRITIELASHMPSSARVEVRERVPLPAAAAESDVVVTVADVEPHWERFEQKSSPVEGAWRWIVDLEPGARRELRARYDVELPSRLELVGGNRREV